MTSSDQPVNLRSRVALNTVIMISGRLCSLAIGVVTIHLMTTYLGVDRFGEYAVVLAITGTTVVLAELGVTSVLSREVSKFPDDADRLGGLLLGYRVVSSLLATLVLLVVVPFLPYTTGTKVALLLATPGVFFLILGGLPNAFFIANMRFKFIAALDVAGRVLGLVAVVLIRVFDLGVNGLVLIQVVSYGLATLAAFVFSRRFWRVNLAFNWQAVRPHVRSGVGIGLASTIGLLVYQGDAILLSLFKTPRAVGIYTVAYRFLDQAFMVPGMFMNIVFPVMTRALHREGDDAERVIRRAFEALSIVGLALGIFVFTLAPYLIRILAGPEFGASVKTLQILAVAIPMLCVSPVFYNILVALDRPRDLISVGIAMLVWDVTSNLLLIPRYSYIGAAIATIMTQTLSFIVLFVVARRRHAFRLQPTFVTRVAAAGVAGAAVIIALRSEPAWLMFLAAEAVYCLGALLFGAVRRSDLRQLVSRFAG